MSEPLPIECRGLDLGYDSTLVLHDIDLAIERNAIVAILGGSGSGKSTMLRTMVGLLAPLKGTVSLFGRNLYGVPPGERALLLRRTGTLFQRDALFESLSVLDNVLLPLRELTELPEPVMVEMARMKLSLVELTGVELRLPSDISGGQRKRAALARAAVLDPQIIFCDEPTTGLDPVVAASLNRNLLELRNVLGVTIVAVTHDIPSVYELADRVVMLGDGRIQAEGSPRELRDSHEPFVHSFFHRVPRGSTGGSRFGTPG